MPETQFEFLRQISSLSQLPDSRPVKLPVSNVLIHRIMNFYGLPDRQNYLRQDSGFSDKDNEHKLIR